MLPTLSVEEGVTERTLVYAVQSVCIFYVLCIVPCTEENKRDEIEVYCRIIRVHYDVIGNCF